LPIRSVSQRSRSRVTCTTFWRNWLYTAVFRLHSTPTTEASTRTFSLPPPSTSSFAILPPNHKQCRSEGHQVQSDRSFLQQHSAISNHTSLQSAPQPVKGLAPLSSSWSITSQCHRWYTIPRFIGDFPPFTRRRISYCVTHYNSRSHLKNCRRCRSSLPRPVIGRRNSPSTGSG
jgi:hypothetical protein